MLKYSSEFCDKYPDYLSTPNLCEIGNLLIMFRLYISGLAAEEQENIRNSLRLIAAALCNRVERSCLDEIRMNPEFISVLEYFGLLGVIPDAPESVNQEAADAT